MKARPCHSAFTTLLLLLAVASPVLGGQATASTVAGVAKTTRPSVVTIRTPSGTGSGVIVDPTGVIVTNLHVVQGDRSATVVLSNGDSYDDVAVVDVDARRDVVLLKVKAFGLTAAKIGNSDRVRVGDRVVLVSSPRGLELTVSDGVISAQRDSGEGYRMLQTTAAASPGSSGGGLFNMAGELVGILSTKRMDGENLNFALPFNYVRGLLATTAQMSLGDLAAKYPASDPAPGAEGSSARDEAQDLAKLSQLLAQTGITVTKESDKLWSADFGGDHTKSIKVLINAANGLVLVSSKVLSEPVTNPAILTELMRLSYDTDYGKLGFDKDMVLWALTEADLTTLDGPRLKTYIRSVATLTDRAVGALVAGASTMLTYNDGRVTLEYGHTAWKPPVGEEGYQLVDARGEAFVKLVVERPEIPTEKLVEIALDNARKADPKLRVIRRDTRTINGARMLVVEFELTSEGIPVTFVGYYYGGPEGAVQILGWTSRNLAKEYRPQFDKLLEGFKLVK